MKKYILFFFVVVALVSCKNMNLTEYDYQEYIKTKMPNARIYKSSNFGSQEFLVVDDSGDVYYVNVTTNFTDLKFAHKDFLFSTRN